ncbi:MAG: class I SAM-dependent methyltransferase [Verrucomicrobia bacterium]|nr:class I SAM-dependent methyltransferase [Verrucomicrobiota bacterium]
MPDSTLSRSCPLCEKDKAHLLFCKDTLHLVRCENCSMVYANPVGSEFASGSFYDQRAESFYLASDKLESDHAPVRFERELKLFRACCHNGSVLDVGCSTGGFLIALKSRHPKDYSVFGTDVVGTALDYAEQHGVQVIRTPFLELSEKEAFFDAVTFWAVIEHLVEPKKFLGKAAELLKPGGFCVVLVPNLKSLAVRILGAKYRYIMPEHVNYFTPATLSAFGQSRPDFEIVRLTSTHFNPIVILKDLTGKERAVPDSERSRLLKRTTAWKQNRWLRPVKAVYSLAERILSTFNLADNLVIILRKNISGSENTARQNQAKPQPQSPKSLKRYKG